MKDYFNKIPAFYKTIIFTAFCFMSACNQASNTKTHFWDNTKKGANIFNQEIRLEDIRAAKKYGIQFIRLAPDKFISCERDFLVGNADNYQGLVKKDLSKLKEVLDLCQKEDMPVVITMLSLPGSRWKQNNNHQDDLRIWTDKKYQAQAALFWKALATEFKNHPNVVGYNLLNEPHPEKLFLKGDKDEAEIKTMLFDFYELLINSIRSVDIKTPIILDSSNHADPKTFAFLKPHSDANIVYSFHMYEPYEYTNYDLNQGKFSYPGQINNKYWDKEALNNYMNAVKCFQKTYDIPSHKILVGEFGANRLSPGIDSYFQDLISIFQKQKWHFTFYAFREDTWPGMDYELGTQKLSWRYWQAIEQGQKPPVERKGNYSTFLILKKALQD